VAEAETLRQRELRLDGTLESRFGGTKGVIPASAQEHGAVRARGEILSGERTGDICCNCG
jgi:hypothetical protein